MDQIRNNNSMYQLFNLQYMNQLNLNKLLNHVIKNSYIELMLVKNSKLYKVLSAHCI